MIYTVKKEEELTQVGKDILQCLARASAALPGAAVLALHGDLGAGKTALTRTIARELGVTEPVTSPTFVIQKHYTLLEQDDVSYTTLVHMDAYRLESTAELDALNFKNTALNPSILLIIEWAERIDSALPEQHLEVYITAGEGGVRTIELRNCPEV
jgi:tRNA threonylcarbamoyladenosine biosynthesis protein TsaE